MSAKKFKKMESYLHKKRIYISGAMTGIPMKNKPMFDKAERYLRKKGYGVINPASKPSEILDRDATEKEYLAYMKEDVYVILYNKGGVDEVWTLPNWWQSRGAVFECYVANFFGISIEHLTEENLNGSKKKRRVKRSISK